MIKITGYILAGGKSSRMGGGIKCFKIFNNKTILDRIITRGEKQVSNLAINSNIQNFKFKKYVLPIFRDSIKGYLGPLAGIHACLNWNKKNFANRKWIITFAGDTPFFPENLVKKLYHEASQDKNNKIILAKSNERIHPVFGIWHSSLENDLALSIKKEKIRKIDQWIKRHKYKIINFSNKKFDPFFNINTPSDLIKAKKIEDQFL